MQSTFANDGNACEISHAVVGAAANDFSIAASPSAVSTPQGVPASTAVNTAVVSGSATSVSLSATGAPAGVTASFGSSSITAGASTTLQLAVASTTTPGSYPLTVKGTSATTTHSTTVTLTVTAVSTGGTQVLAVGAADTNLSTENVWPGAQNPPYIAGWGKQGQYVTFTFSVAAGTTKLALRYSAGNGVATRKIELDGAVTVANQSFPKTTNWSTWGTVTLSRTLSAGTHTLKLWFDSTAGSKQWLNLDNLTVTGAAPPVTPAPPVNTTPPAITGTAQQGQTLTASTGSWTNSPTSYAYAWSHCTPTCSAISGATKSTYLLAAADVGTTVTVTVTASNAGGPGAPATSAPTATVTALPVSVTQVLAAGAADTNLPTENVWPGAQNPPYIVGWGKQGQYVTFTFTVTVGTTKLVLRYSAGNGVATRKIELDGAVTVANQSFPKTTNWSTWGTVTLSRTLSAGTHTLKLWFDSTAGSKQWLNLDNLTITSG